jgi:hypothetical protein
MSTIVQICIVIVTIAVLAMAYVALRVMLQLRTTTKKIEASYVYLQAILEDSRKTSKMALELMTNLDQIARSARGGAARIEDVVDRASSISMLVLDEIQPPVLQAVTLMRALRSGARAVARRWTNGRATAVHSPEGENHV